MTSTKSNRTLINQSSSNIETRIERTLDPQKKPSSPKASRQLTSNWIEIEHAVTRHAQALLPAQVCFFKGHELGTFTSKES
jgi:hypothetical protein